MVGDGISINAYRLACSGLTIRSMLKVMGGRDIVVIGASAGGLGALRRVLRRLPADFPAAIFVVLHSPPTSEVQLDVFRSQSNLPLRFAIHGERLRRAQIYVAPADDHLLVERGRIRLERGPKETRQRPSADTLFRSAALAYGRRVVGVILSGTLTDGTLGLWEVKKRGGVTIVQDPRDTTHEGMVQSAIANVPVDHCVPADDMAQLLVDLTTTNPTPPPFDSPQPAKVLIVEDERIVATNLERRLRDLGYEVTASVSSGPAALHAAGDDRPDVVLMDIRLSAAMDGTEAARQLWERFQIPVVYVTAYADPATLADVKMTEAYGYVYKPFQPEEIHVAIQLALERRDRETREA